MRLPLRGTSRSVLSGSVDSEARWNAWAAYSAEHPEAALFQQPRWARAVARSFGHEVRTLLAWRGERVVGVFPLMLVRSWLAGKLLVSMPYATGGGVLADDDESRLTLAAGATDLALAERCRALQVRSRRAEIPGFEDDRRYAGFVRALPTRTADLPQFLPRKARAAVRQAENREQLRTRHDARDLTTVWQLYARSMRRLGSITYPYSFFRELVRQLGPGAWTTLVTHADGRPVAGLLSLAYRQTVMPYFVGVDERISAPGATNLIYFAVMKRAVERGYELFDFGRTRYGNEGPFAFKKNQGFVPDTLGYQLHIPPGATSPDLTPSNPRFAMARHCWPRLPLTVTNLLGRALAPAIPG